MMKSDILFLIFKTSLRQGTFPNRYKIPSVTRLFKSGDGENVAKYRLISALLVFSRNLETIMNNRIYKHLKSNSWLFDKQFGFQLNNFTEYLIFQLVNDFLSSFERREYTLWIFIDFSRVFDTVDHKILISKLEHYRIKEKIFKWLESYLSKRRECKLYSNIDKTSM